MSVVRTRTLVAGIGNVFLGDDGFGCAVVRKLVEAYLPEHVHAVDYGIRGVHLAYDILDGYDALIVVDALPAGQQPGTLRTLEVGNEHLDPASGVDAHSMHPAAVLSNVTALGGTLPRTFVVGCEPATTAETMGLSETVAASVGPAAEFVWSLLTGELGYSSSQKQERLSKQPREREIDA